MRNNLDRKLFLVSFLLLFGLIFFIGSSFLIKPKVIEIIPLPAQISENTLNQDKSEEITLPEKETSEEELSLPQIYLSSDKLEQADTLLITVKTKSSINKISGKLESTKINFFKPAISNNWNWVAIVGISVKEKPGKYNLVINFPDGRKIEKKLTIIEREFPITKLLVTKELEEKGYTPSKIVENITTKENVVLREILSIYTEKSYFNKAFTYPLEKIKDVGAFGDIRKSENFAFQHLGVDLEADTDTPVYAINDGLVRFSQDLTTYGKTLIIDHGLGIFSLYLHLSEFKVSEEELVKQEDIIGLSGNTGYSIAPHLHFSVKVNNASVDPLRFIETVEKEMIE